MGVTVENAYGNGDGTNEELVLRAADEIVVHEVEVVRMEKRLQRLFRQFDNAAWRSGLRDITGPQFASFDPATALIHFQALTLDRFRNVIDFLAEGAKAKGRSTPRVPAPLSVIATVNIQMTLDLGHQPPEKGRGPADGRIAT
jgi:hypothetical protein